MRLGLTERVLESSWDGNGRDGIPSPDRIGSTARKDYENRANMQVGSPGKSQEKHDLKGRLRASFNEAA